MKAIRHENGNVVAYVKNRDVEILKTMKGMIDSGIFEEDSIASNLVDENGYYRITNENNIGYLASLPFIPDYDDLCDLDISELLILVRKNGMYSYDINSIFIKEEELSQEDIEFLRTFESISPEYINALENAKSIEEMKFLRCCIRQQIRCYSYSLREMISHKEKVLKEEEEKQKEERKHRFIKMLKRIGNNKK